MNLNYNKRIEHFNILNFNNKKMQISNTKLNFTLIFINIADNNKEKVRSNAYINIIDNIKYHNIIFNYLFSKKQIMDHEGQ